MRSEEFSKMRALQDSHWWFMGRRHLLRNLVKALGIRDAVVLDAGCGTGFAGEELQHLGNVIGLDSCEEAILPRDDVAACIAEIEDTPFPNETFDLIIALDLLEHLEDDIIALKEMRRICKPGGFLFVTVPAYQAIWSRHDEALGHRRRYSMSQLNDALSNAGFQVCKRSYTVTAIFPLVALHRLVRRKYSRAAAETDLAPVPRPINTALAGIMKCESWLSWKVGLPFGLTVFALARRVPEDEE